MKTTASSLSALIETSRRLKQFSVCAICGIALLLSGTFGIRWIGGMCRPSSASHTSTQIEQQALQIAASLRPDARLLTPPVLNVHSVAGAGPCVGPRSFWVALCEAGHQQMNMLFDDKSGRLICLIMDMPAKSETRKAQPLDTQAQAIRVGVERLKAMRVLPTGAEIALQEPPRRDTHSEYWNMTWLVRTPGTPRPFQIKLRLDCGLGLPMAMEDLQQSG